MVYPPAAIEHELHPAYFYIPQESYNSILYFPDYLLLFSQIPEDHKNPLPFYSSQWDNNSLQFF